MTDDYDMRIAESSVRWRMVLESRWRSFWVATARSHCNCNVAQDCLNISVCEYTATHDSFSIVAWNPLGQNVPNAIMRIPVVASADDTWTVDGVSKTQLVPIDERTLELPKLYLNKFGMNAAQIAEAGPLLRTVRRTSSSFKGTSPHGDTRRSRSEKNAASPTPRRTVVADSSTTTTTSRATPTA